MFRSPTQLVGWLRKSRDGQRILRECHPYAFDSLQQIEKWLANSEEGEDLLERFIGYQRRRRVLVVLMSDGWVEAYGDSHTDVRIMNKIHATSREGALMAEECMAYSLPYTYRELLWPGNRRAFGQVRKVTARQMLDARMELKVLEAIERCS